MINQEFDYSKALISPTDASEYCSKYIIKHYSLGKQMTIEQRGSEEEKQKMHQFIDTCIGWSNSENLRLKDLYEIKP